MRIQRPAVRTWSSMKSLRPADTGAEVRGQLIRARVRAAYPARHRQTGAMDQVSPQRRSRISRLLSAIDRVAARPSLAAVILLGDVAWVGFSVTVKFAPRLEVIFQTLVAAATLAMVFVIQHTQARQQAATQRKLDEILRALPEADNRYLALEHAPDPVLRAARESHGRDRDAALTTHSTLSTE